MKLFGLDNVYYEDNSGFLIEELNESVFVERVIDHLKKLMGTSFFDFEFHIFSNRDRTKTPKSSKKYTSKRKILIYISDESGSDPGAYADDYYAIFKSYIDTYQERGNIFSLPLGYVRGVPELPVIPINERQHNVFFRGNLNSNRIDFYRSFCKLKFLLPGQKLTTRTSYRNLLVKLKSDQSNYFPKSIIRFNSGFKAGYSTEEYGKILAESKIVLCPKGFSMTESFRHFEAMRAGCILISEPLPANDFYKGSPIIQIEDWEKGLAVAKDLIKNPDRMNQIHQETLTWWKEKCSESGTAKYILNKINVLALVEN